MNREDSLRVTLTYHEIEVLFAYWAKEYYTEWASAIEYGYGLDNAATAHAEYRMEILSRGMDISHANDVLRKIRDEFKDSDSLPILQHN